VTDDFEFNVYHSGVRRLLNWTKFQLFAAKRPPSAVNSAGGERVELLWATVSFLNKT
jgi:hypothetical protein